MRRKTTPTPEPVSPPTPFCIDPDAAYRPETIRRGLGLKAHCLGREIRQGRLRVTRRGGLYFILGKWLLEWLEAGEVKRTNEMSR